MIPDLPSHVTPDVDTITEALYLQLMNVMGQKQPGSVTRLLRPFFRPPTRHLSGLLVELDRNIAQAGLSSAINQFMQYFVTEHKVINAQAVSVSGPLLVVGNHPAAFDIVVLVSSIMRDDLNVIISDIPILKLLPDIYAHCIPVPYHIPSRLATVRTSIQHLRNGGTLFIFPRGNVEPDPAVSPGAEQSLSGWSASIELFLRQVPQTQTVVAISSGMLSAKWYKNPLIRLWKKYEQRQKVAEIFQIASQIITRRRPSAIPMVSFSAPLSVHDLGGLDAPQGVLLSAIIEQAKILLADHPHIEP